MVPNKGVKVSWPANVAKNIFPLSREKEDLIKALAEWIYTDRCYDLESAEEICQLCDHENIRYQFEIQNKQTGEILLIGSECIKRFDIKAIDSGGRVLSQDETNRKVNKARGKLIADAKKKKLINTLLLLASVENTVNINSFIDDYNIRGAFTPRQLLYLLDLLSRYKIPADRSCFKMALKKGYWRNQLHEMSPHDLIRLWPCLSAAQRKYFNEHLNFERQREQFEQSEQELNELVAKTMNG